MRNATGRERDVAIAADPGVVHGTLRVPEGASGLVLFAHGSGSSRFSPRNRRVAAALGEERLATLLFDLLTEREEASDALDARLRFDIDLLARRLGRATDWALADPETHPLALGYFGSSTGAAAALVAAAERPHTVHAVVSRGGRPDLAGEALGRVRAPTLLLVGGADPQVVALNRQAMQQMAAPARLDIVPGATHLFEEPGALETVARLAAEWFRIHLPVHARETVRAGREEES